MHNPRTATARGTQFEEKVKRMEECWDCAAMFQGCREIGGLTKTTPGNGLLRVSVLACGYQSRSERGPARGNLLVANKEL